MSAEESLREGIRLARTGALVAAEATLREAVKQSPQIVEAHLHLGDALKRQSRPAEAAAAFEAGLEHAEGDAPRLHRLGVLLQSVLAFPSAERAQRAALAADPKLASAHVSLAALLQGRRAFADAADHLASAGELDPSNAVIQQRLGIVLQATQDFEAAEAAHRRAVELDPENLTARRQLAAILYRVFKEPEARVEFTAAQALGAQQMPTSAIAALTDLESGAARQPGGRKVTTARRPLLPSREGWDAERRFRWGRHAQDFTRTLLFLKPDALDELDRLIDAPDWASVAARFEGERGAVFVDTHVGLPHISLARLVRSPFQARIVNVNPEALLSLPPDVGVNARAADNHLAIARMLPVIRQGGVVFTAGDGGIGQKGARRTFGGYSAALALGPPTLAFAAKCSIFWYAALWKQRRIAVEIIEGPRVREGESLADFQGRWMDFYWERLCAALQSGPENVDRRQFEALYLAEPVSPR